MTFPSLSGPTLLLPEGGKEGGEDRGREKETEREKGREGEGGTRGRGRGKETETEMGEETDRVHAQRQPSGPQDRQSRLTGAGTARLGS